MPALSTSAFVVILRPALSLEFYDSSGFTSVCMSINKTMKENNISRVQK